MQKVRVPVNGFQYGEVSESLQMRTDASIYAQSAQKLENMLVMPEGSVKKRYGLKHIYDYSLVSSGQAQSHLFSFIYDENEEYIISVEEAKIRCFRLLTDGSVSLVQTITQDAYGDPLPFDEDYIQEYTNSQYGDVMFICHPLFAPRMLTRTSLTTFEVQTFSFDQRADGEFLYQPYTAFQAQNVYLDPEAVNGTTDVYVATRTAEIDYDAICLSYTGSGSLTINGVLASGGVATIDPPRRLTVLEGTTNSINFTINGTDSEGNSISEVVAKSGVAVFTTTKYFATVTSITVSSAVAAAQVGVSEFQLEPHFDTTGTETGGVYPDSKHLGVTLRYDGNEAVITAVKNSYVATVDIVNYFSRRLTILNPFRTRAGSAAVEVIMFNHGFGGGESITIFDASAVGGINAGNLNGVRTVDTIIDDNTFTFAAGGSASSAEDGGGQVTIQTHAPTNSWDEQSWSAVRGYPAAVTFHQNRLCFAGTIAEPDTIWMSKIGRFFNFDLGDAADDDAIALVAATGEVNHVKYLVSNRDLQVFTASGELYVPTFLNQAITPTNVQIRLQTPYGSEYVQPASIDGATIFAAINGKVIREYLYTDAEDAYTANSISTLAPHLINTPKCLAVAHSGFGLSDSYACMTMGNGTAALFTSNRAEKRAAWTSVTTPGRFCSVVALEDRLFANVYDEDDNLHLCEFTGDIGLDFYLYVPVSSNLADVSSLYSSGDSVDVIGDNGTQLDYLGQLTVNGSNQVDLTAYPGYSNVYVGKKFTARIITNPIDAIVSNGPATATIRGLANVVVDARDTRSLRVNNRPVTINGTGKKEVRVLGHSRDPKVTITQDQPLTMQVNGLAMELVF